MMAQAMVCEAGPWNIDQENSSTIGSQDGCTFGARLGRSLGSIARSTNISERPDVTRVALSNRLRLGGALSKPSTQGSSSKVLCATWPRHCVES
jgi:hypothetical protein